MMKSPGKQWMLAAAAGLMLAACGGSQAPVGEGPAGEGPAGDAVATPAPAEVLGSAKDATVLAEDGSHVQLASAWMNTHAVIIFLRGHW